MSNRSTHRDPAGAPPALVWPKSLARKAEQVPIIYLDLNHWIGLAKAAIGHSNGHRYVPLLVAAERVSKLGAGIFVLGDVHYCELARISDPRQRGDVAAVMERLTRFTTVAGRVDVARIEINAVVDQLRGIHRSRHGSQLLGYGVGHAFGSSIRSEFGQDEEWRRANRAIRLIAKDSSYEKALRLARYDLERSSLAGPLDSEVDNLRQYGWAPEKVWETSNSRLQQELDQVARLDAESRWRRGRLRDVVSVREYIIELQGLVRRELEHRGLGEKDVVRADRKALREFIRGMPSTEVAIELKTSLHRNPRHPWSVNDIHDIDAMAVAVPYCDIVFTDSAVRSRAVDAGLHRRMNTRLPRFVEELTQILNELTPQ